jgi:hypothetical protein
MDEEKKYQKPKIKSSKVSPISFYNPQDITIKGLADSEYLLAAPIS